MTEAALTLRALEEIRHAMLLKLTALDNDRPKIAYAAVAEDSLTAKQKWSQLDEQADRLLERIRLFDAAIFEARRRASHPDYREQWRAITKMEWEKTK